jgi:hypothetical protein
MVTITLKYTDYGDDDTKEFREYTKNLVGYRDASEYKIKFGVENDPMFDTKIVCEISISDEDYAFDVVKHFMLDREVNGDSIPFSVDITSVALYVSGSDQIMNYITSRSFSHLYERIEILEDSLRTSIKKCNEVAHLQERSAAFIQLMGIDKFPDIVKQLIDSMEAEGHSCKEEINKILQRKVH